MEEMLGKLQLLSMQLGPRLLFWIRILCGPWDHGILFSNMQIQDDWTESSYQ